jgi:hypothetical protein
MKRGEDEKWEVFFGNYMVKKLGTWVSVRKKLPLSKRCGFRP